MWYSTLDKLCQNIVRKVPPGSSTNFRYFIHFNAYLWIYFTFPTFYALFFSQFEFLLNFFHRLLIKPNEALYLCRNSHELNDIYFFMFLHDTMEFCYYFIILWFKVIILAPFLWLGIKFNKNSRKFDENLRFRIYSMLLKLRELH